MHKQAGNKDFARRVVMGLEVDCELSADDARALEVLVGYDDGPARKRRGRRRLEKLSPFYLRTRRARPYSLQRRAWIEQTRGFRVLRLMRSPDKRDRAIASLYFDGLPINRPMIEAALLVGPERLGAVAAGRLPWVAIADHYTHFAPCVVAAIQRARLAGGLAVGRRLRRARA